MIKHNGRTYVVIKFILFIACYNINIYFGSNVVVNWIKHTKCSQHNAALQAERYNLELCNFLKCFFFFSLYLPYYTNGITKWIGQMYYNKYRMEKLKCSIRFNNYYTNTLATHDFTFHIANFWSHQCYRTSLPRSVYSERIKLDRKFW